MSLLVESFESLFCFCNREKGLALDSVRRDAGQLFDEMYFVERLFQETMQHILYAYSYTVSESWWRRLQDGWIDDGV